MFSLKYTINTTLKHNLPETSFPQRFCIQTAFNSSARNMQSGQPAEGCGYCNHKGPCADFFFMGKH